MISVAQSTLLGNTGLIIIPTAYLEKDANVRITGGYVPRPFYTVDKPKYDHYSTFLSLVYLPFMEITFGIVSPINEVYGIGDRTAVLRICLLHENKKWPQITIGAQDPFGFIAQDWAQRFCTLYTVASKSYKPPLMYRASIHLGQGVNWIRAGQYYLIGTFAGIELEPIEHVTGIMEYDTKRINYGIRLSLWRFDLLGSWLDGRHFSGNLGFHFSLQPRPISSK